MILSNFDQVVKEFFYYKSGLYIVFLTKLNFFLTCCKSYLVATITMLKYFQDAKYVGALF